MMHVIIGLFVISLGVWGVFDEWYYVVDFLKGFFSIFLVGIGLVAILAGVVDPKRKTEPAATQTGPGSGFNHRKDD